MNAIENPFAWRYPSAGGAPMSAHPRPRRDAQCEVVDVALTLPPTFPRERVVVNPTQRRLYMRDAEGKNAQNWYPPQTINRPVGTMYERDFSQFQPNGKRVSYTRMMYPLHDRVVRETSTFSNVVLAPIQIGDGKRCCPIATRTHLD